MSSEEPKTCPICAHDEHCSNLGKCVDKKCSCIPFFDGEDCKNAKFETGPKQTMPDSFHICNSNDSCKNGQVCYDFPHAISTNYGSCKYESNIGRSSKNRVFIYKNFSEKSVMAVVQTKLASKKETIALTCKATKCKTIGALNSDKWECDKLECSKPSLDAMGDEMIHAQFENFVNQLQTMQRRPGFPLAILECKGKAYSKSSIADGPKKAVPSHACNLIIADFPVSMKNCVFGQCALPNVEFPIYEMPPVNNHSLNCRIAFYSFIGVLFLVFAAFLGYGFLQRHRLRRKKGDTSREPCEYVYENVQYTLRGRRILQGISGRLVPGTVNAIIGPSGAGKSTLLEILAHVRSYGNIGGTFKIGNQLLSHPDRTFRRHIGFVNQADYLVPWLTVMESMRFAVDTRLPEHYSKKQKNDIIDEILSELNLKQVRHSFIGGSGAPRGLSGGEIRRLSIAIEIVTGPSIIFLDEPTSGLDSHNAFQLVATLRQLAITHNKIVMCSIHQPRPDIFAMFHTTTLIGQGIMLYGGPTEKLGEHLASRGFVCPNAVSIADHALDVALGGEFIGLVIENPQMCADEQEGNSEKNLNPNYDAEMNKSSENVVVSLEMPKNALFHSAEMMKSCSSQKSHASNIEDGVVSQSLSSSYPVVLVEATAAERFHEKGTEIEITDDLAIAGRKQSFEYPTSCITQLKCLLRRGFLCLIRDRQMFFGHLLFCLVSSLLIGIFYYDLSDTMSGIQNRLAVVLFLQQVIAFMSTSTISNLSKDMAVFKHESSNGNYRPWLYVLVKIFTDLVPLRLAPTVLSLVMTFYMAGLSSGFIKLFTFLLVNGLFCVSAYLIAFLVGLLIRDSGVSSIIYIMVMTFSSAFCGVTISLKEMSSFISWIQYISIQRYATEVLLVSEIYGNSYKYIGEGSDTPIMYISGDYVLRGILSLSVENNDLDLVILFGMNAILLFVCLLLTSYKITDTR